MRSTLLCIAALAFFSLLMDQHGEVSGGLQAGVIVAKMPSASHPELSYSYAIYLPVNYTAEKRWPIIYAFDPAARGSVPVQLMKDAAERYGYIVVGSNNSRNGSSKPQTESAQAMYQDTHANLAIDDRRIYFAGFSGGARVASFLAQSCKCAAGVLLNGAGFSAGSPPSAETTPVILFGSKQPAPLWNQAQASHLLSLLSDLRRLRSRCQTPIPLILPTDATPPLSISHSVLQTYP